MVVLCTIQHCAEDFIVHTTIAESRIRAPSAEVQAREKSELCKRNAPQW